MTICVSGANSGLKGIFRSSHLRTLGPQLITLLFRIRQSLMALLALPPGCEAEKYRNPCGRFQQVRRVYD
jgi:hypothetical protein